MAERDDPFDIAAQRTRRAVRPEEGRKEGLATMLPGQYLAHVLKGLASLPERATQAAGSLQYGGSYDPGPALEVAMLMGGAPRGAIGAGPIRAYHGSPHEFERFDISKIGTGEGSQAYGHGLYFAENPKVAAQYRQAPSFRYSGGSPESIAASYWRKAGQSSEKATALFDKDWRGLFSAYNPRFGSYGSEPLPANYQGARDLLASGWAPKGKTYEVNIHADPSEFINLDKPMREQSQRVQDLYASQEAVAKDLYGKSYLPLMPGMDIKSMIPRGPETAAAYAERGIPGIAFLDQFSRRGVRQPTSNYVTFRDDIIDILRKYGLAGAIPAGSAAMSPPPRRDAEDF